MRPLPTAALVAAILALASFACARGIRPRRRSLAQVRALLYPTAPARRAGAGPSGPARRSRGLDAISGPLARVIERTSGDGLRFVDLDATVLASRIVVAAAGAVFVTTSAAGAGVARGVLPANPMWLLLSILAAGIAGWVTWIDVQRRIGRRRLEFGRTTTDFIQLVAVGLTTDQSVEEATQFALSVGDSDVFELIRTDLATAPLRGVPLWEALDQLGVRYRQRELSELGNSIERQGTQGVSITETVTTLATAMRERALDELEREADRVNANLAGPTICFVVTTIVFLAYPLAIRIGGAFGG